MNPAYPSTTPATRSKMDKGRNEAKTPHDLSDPCRLSSHCAIIGRATHTAFRLQVPGIYGFPAYTFHSVRRADPELPVASGCSSFHQAERPRAATIRPSQGSILYQDRQPPESRLFYYFRSISFKLTSVHDESPGFP
ncbi:hypothetical protein QR685DRAFT_567338 [Neurospora intermedia]|uniref:Questionable protein n=1 Tax=Neurospora intermedia TaxID=5142 RepID=A0ABR3DPY5_NEUIN